MSGQLSKAKETPSNQPSESEEVSRIIIANSLGSSNIEAEPIQARFYIFEDCPYPLSQRAPDPQCSDGTVFESAHLEPSLGDHLPSNYGSLKPGETYKYGVFTVIKGVENNAPLGIAPCRSHTVKGLSIAVDAEWDKDGNWLSTSFTTNVDGHFMRHFFVVDTLPAETLEQLRTTAFLSGDKFHTVNADENNRHFLPTVIADADPHQRYKTVTLLFFYSPKDLEYSLGFNYVKPLYERKRDGITQKRCLKGEFDLDVGDRSVTVTLRDLAGVSAGSLKRWVEGLGIDPKDKGCMDDYKSNMRQGFIDKPERAYAYSRNDSDLLHHAYIAFEKLVRWVEHDVIGIAAPPLGSEGSIRETTGALIAETFTSFLHSRATHPVQLMIALNKLGDLDTSHWKYFDNRKNYKLGCDLLKSATLPLSADDELRIWKLLNKVVYRITGLGQCSVQKFAIKEDSSTFNALVQGGRCNNERPTKYKVERGADIDLSGCYGTALEKFTYPIGLPTVWGMQANDPPMKFGVWLGQNKSQLSDNLWTATVTGNLDFIQDLIYSKIVTKDQINKAAHIGFDKSFQDDERDDDLSHIPGDFALIRKEIQNGIITSEVLKIIRAVATNIELKQLMMLDLVSAAAYLKCDEVSSVDEWVDIVLKDKGSFRNVKCRSGNSVDDRTTKWVGVPLRDFIGQLVKERQRIKSTDKAKSNALKLFINTLYGDLASPYFKFGNTVLANNITARARVGTWLLNKALHTHQSITDGGIYTPTSVPYLKERSKKPGLALLADNTRWVDGHGSRGVKSLGGVDWKAIYDDDWRSLPEHVAKTRLTELGKRLDDLTTQHVKEFWEPYDLSLPFKIEHKGENTFSVGAYTSKAHYALRPLWGVDVFKIRGAKDHKPESNLKKSPTYSILTSVLNGENEMPDNLGYDHSYFLKLGLWALSQKSIEGTYAEIEGKRPGDLVIQARTTRYNNTQFPCDTIDEYKRRKDRKTKQNGNPAQWFERHRDRGWYFVQKQALKDAKFEHKDI